jgi:hypothetical protein
MIWDLINTYSSSAIVILPTKEQRMSLKVSIELVDDIIVTKNIDSGNGILIQITCMSEFLIVNLWHVMPNEVIERSEFDHMRLVEIPTINKGPTGNANMRSVPSTVLCFLLPLNLAV